MREQMNDEELNFAAKAIIDTLMADTRPAEAVTILCIALVMVRVNIAFSGSYDEYVKMVADTLKTFEPEGELAQLH